MARDTSALDQSEEAPTAVQRNLGVAAKTPSQGVTNDQLESLFRAALMRPSAVERTRTAHGRAANRESTIWA
eukprot:CAMPEP_0180556592 /NCGR_PEP_ID=MMETSP1037_2-20121125/679_1 /TAXON_ID=632150 /ORGANISM="Azadinium spinosum, Strain 3D9" /LENGTH=71 /DNA_ID=CAMNT_0022572675 /DNA_START=24 /DNA_END=239 /DNA_ORIENTATION=-